LYKYTNISIYFSGTTRRLYIKPTLKRSHALVTPSIILLLRHPRVAHEFSSPWIPVLLYLSPTLHDIQ